ncbi:MAG: hypothetical protein IJB59_01740 [Oscillospiraceae bacterium]|nr:hypothetical protein [Oscillospiraceae bacterium]
MNKKAWKLILLHVLLLCGFACGVLLFAEEILEAKRWVYAAIAQVRQHNTQQDQSPLEQQFASYAPMEHKGDEWYQDTRLIYHAGGTIDGFVYTNSAEALEATISGGNHVVEIDFLFTSDGHLICAHKWEDLFSLEPLPLEEVQRVGIYRKYTPMTAEDLIGYMQENPDLIIITDTKEEQPVEVIRELVRLAGEDADILSRFVIQLYDRGMKQEMLSVYPFSSENFLFTAYEFGNERIEEILELCYAEDIRVVTVVYYAWPQEVIDLFRQKGIFVFEHTVNDPSEARDIIARGSQGVYTDFLQLSDLTGE